MKLIKVEAKGFKSFADKITLNFDGGVVGIVGPNGSGKSNINDAIKWVLGESSAKSLRGDSMEDVIFAGSKTVKAMDRAEVSLTFDNSERRVSLPHKTIIITRRITRGKGGNQYFINGEIARLKDIKEIAMETGMSKSSLAIIGQGTVADIAEANPEQRRGIFEEAAGISKYKVRKKESLKKLDKVTEGLEKIQMVTLELEKQLIPLKKQAIKAKEFIKMRNQLKGIEVGLIVKDVEFFNKKLKELNLELEDFISSKEDMTEKVSIMENEIEEKTEYKLNLENEVLNLTTKFQEVSDKLRDLEIIDSQAAQRRKMIIDGEIKSTSKERLEVIKSELEELRAKVSQYNIWETKSRDDIIEKRGRVATVQVKVSKMNLEIERNKNNLLKMKTKISILKDQRDNKTNLFKGTKTIMDNSSIFPGLHGVVSDLLSVDVQYRIAIESILQNTLQHIVVEESEDAVKAVNFLKNNNGGRATFIPLSSIQAKSIRSEYESVIRSQFGFVGIASSMVNVDPKFNKLKEFLLGNIILADNIDNANYIAKLINRRNMIVTLEGDVIRVGGVISGGTAGKSRNMISVGEEIKRYESIIPTLNTEIEVKTSEVNRLSLSISEEQALIAELNIETAKVIEKRNIVQSQFETLKTQYESESKEKIEFKNETMEIESVELFESEKSSIQALLKAKRESIMNLNNDLSKIILSKTELEKTLRELIEESSEKITQKNQAEYIISTSKQRLSEEYEMTVESAKEQFNLEQDREDARKIVTDLRSEIRDLGHVNLDSIESYNRVNERFQKLSNSQEELFMAQQKILSAINEMDQIIVSRLDKTVQAVNKEINNIFQTMFGGGHAEVKYTDPSNLLETGIDVIAQPPGKTVKNLKLFSGGEKALIAISLLFAILKSKPLPLVILDEVEAALDDANVIRYANFLQELKQFTQFLVVTHRVGTMSRVDHLFGATMQQRGVTSFFTVELSKAKEMIGQ